MPSTPNRARYLQIADELRTKIRKGTYSVGEALPSTSALMRTHDVSITVARAAIKELQNEGVAIGQPGKGVFVRREPEPDEPSTEYAELMERITDLRETVTRSVDQLAERVAALEKTRPRRR